MWLLLEMCIKLEKKYMNEKLCRVLPCQVKNSEPHLAGSELQNGRFKVWVQKDILVVDNVAWLERKILAYSELQMSR